jgi:hypothetical protein
MPNVLNGTYLAYLNTFGPKSGEQWETLRDWILRVANSVPKVYTMLQVDPIPLGFHSSPDMLCSITIGAATLG